MSIESTIAMKILNNYSIRCFIDVTEMTFIDIIEQEYVIEYFLYVEIDLFDLLNAIIAECMNLFP